MAEITVNGINVYYETTGGKEPIVLISGLGTDHTLLDGLAKELAKQHKVLAFDNRGCGQSDKPGQRYTIAQMATDTSELMLALGIENAAIVGVSMGGKIAIELALNFPDRVDHLILISTSLSPSRISTFSKSIKFIRSKLSPAQQPYAAFINQLLASRAYVGYASIASIRCRTLLMAGAKDKRVSSSDIKEFQSKLPQMETVIFPQGHMFFLWNTKQVAERITIFLNRSD